MRSPSDWGPPDDSSSPAGQENRDQRMFSIGDSEEVALRPSRSR